MSSLLLQPWRDAYCKALAPELTTAHHRYAEEAVRVITALADTPTTPPTPVSPTPETPSPSKAETEGVRLGQFGRAVEDLHVCLAGGKLADAVKMSMYLIQLVTFPFPSPLPDPKLPTAKPIPQLQTSPSKHQSRHSPEPLAQVGDCDEAGGGDDEAEEISIEIANACHEKVHVALLLHNPSSLLMNPPFHADSCATTGPGGGVCQAAVHMPRGRDVTHLGIAVGRVPGIGRAGSGYS